MRLLILLRGADFSEGLIISAMLNLMLVVLKLLTVFLQTRVSYGVHVLNSFSTFWKVKSPLFGNEKTLPGSHAR